MSVFKTMSTQKRSLFFLKTGKEKFSSISAFLSVPDWGTWGGVGGMALWEPQNPTPLQV